MPVMPAQLISIQRPERSGFWQTRWSYSILPSSLPLFAPALMCC